MFNKKGQIGAIMAGLAIFVVVGVIILSVLNGQVKLATEVQSGYNETLAVTANTFKALTYKVVNGTETVGNNTATLVYGHGYVFNKALTSINISNGSASWWVKYDGTDASYADSGNVRTILSYLPLMLGVFLFVVVAGYVVLRK